MPGIAAAGLARGERGLDVAVADDMDGEIENAGAAEPRQVVVDAPRLPARVGEDSGVGGLEFALSGHQRERRRLDARAEAYDP